MMFDIQISRQADNDLRGIYEYIAYELMEPESGEKQLEHLNKATGKLDNMPERFRQYEREPWRSSGLRVLPVDNYLVFYIPKNDEKVVTVIRVMYAGRDIDKQSKYYIDFKKSL